ncbi:MAG: STAS domain-containing protein [Acidobacteriota bacterium]
MGEFHLDTGQSGRVCLVFSGEFSLADAPALKQALVGALGDSDPVLALNLQDMDNADLTFFQLLFALSSQARLDGKRVVLDTSMPDSLYRRAEELGFARRDFEHVFHNEEVR